MVLIPRLEMRQSQGLTITPQLMQSIKLLQLSHLELMAFVEAELERNPLIERLEEDASPAREKRDEFIKPQEGASKAGEDQVDLDNFEPAEWMQNNLEISASSISDKLDASLVNVFPDDNEKSPDNQLLKDPLHQSDQWTSLPSYSTASSEDYNIEAFIANDITLRDHLQGQLMLTGCDIITATIARELLDHVDESGYMRGDLTEISRRLGVSLEKMQAALDLIQTFEPIGICARDLQECLKIQLKEMDRLDPAMDALVDHLELLGKRDFVALGKICGVGRDDLVDMMQEIQALDPKPGTLFEHTPLSPAVPDVIVTAANDGSWNVELNTETLPRILVNQSYFAKVSNAAKNKKETEFLNDCLQTANWLHKSLDQRAQTILKVVSEIVCQQDAFLLHGVQHLKPLNLRTVADAIGMHESTVSRVTSNKYMLTGRGIFELKYFFTTAIQSTGDHEAFSAESVRHKVRQMIDEESPAKVLSDDKIVVILREAGIDIARRTVAKYREAMHIPSSVQRRREKKALAALK
jgi:RNA polymerase sigma-54 factor